MSGVGLQAVDHDKGDHIRSITSARRLHVAHSIAVAILSLAILTGGREARAQSDAVPPPLSDAQKVLFQTSHLANVTRPETLEYQFTQLGPQGFTDRVAVTVAEIHDNGTKDLRFDFLTGERRVTFPGIANFTANPVLMLFMEYDVRQMHDQTAMAAAYFRDRLRQAFLDGATVSEGTAPFDGRTVPTRTVTVLPYAGDPRLGRVKVIANKSYTFVMSPDVPGGVLSIRADAPADPSIGAPALGNAIMFEAVHS